MKALERFVLQCRSEGKKNLHARITRHSGTFASFLVDNQERLENSLRGDTVSPLEFSLQQYRAKERLGYK